MTENDHRGPGAPGPAYAPPAGSKTEHTLEGASGSLGYAALADWIVLRKRDEPIAELFHVTYLDEGSDPATRPLTFVLNGGAGAASAYLHVGAVGPLRVAFEPNGDLRPPPAGWSRTGTPGSRSPTWSSSTRSARG